MINILKKLKDDPGSNFSLADSLLFAQIPNPWAAIPATTIAGYIFLRSAAKGRLQKALERIERPVGNLFLSIHDKIPLLNRIDAEEFGKENPGSTLLTVGVAQSVVFVGSLVVAALHPGEPMGWLAAAASGFFTGSNIKFGLQLNDPSRIKAEKTWLDVVTSPQFLVAGGSCCSGLMAGLTTSFGGFAAIPVVTALGSAALVCTGKIGQVKLNTGAPMAALTTVAGLNAVIGFLNGRWLAAFTNVFSANGERILTGFFNRDYQQTRPKEPVQSRFRQAMQKIFYRAIPQSPQAEAPSSLPLEQKELPPLSVERPKVSGDPPAHFTKDL